MELVAAGLHAQIVDPSQRKVSAELDMWFSLAIQLAKLG